MGKAEMMRSLKDGKTKPEGTSSSHLLGSKGKRKASVNKDERRKKHRDRATMTETAPAIVLETPMGKPIGTMEDLPEHQSPDAPPVVHPRAPPWYGVVKQSTDSLDHNEIVMTRHSMDEVLNRHNELMRQIEELRAWRDEEKKSFLLELEAIRAQVQSSDACVQSSEFRAQHAEEENKGLQYEVKSESLGLIRTWLRRMSGALFLDVVQALEDIPEEGEGCAEMVGIGTNESWAYGTELFGLCVNESWAYDAKLVRLCANKSSDYGAELVGIVPARVGLSAPSWLGFVPTRVGLSVLSCSGFVPTRFDFMVLSLLGGLCANDIWAYGVELVGLTDALRITNFQADWTYRLASLLDLLILEQTAPIDATEPTNELPPRQTVKLRDREVFPLRVSLVRSVGAYLGGTCLDE
ncbi:hypothetical protein F511_11113 [Dorcoceras hygrometricum]|uniref:Uncharacterized protein n=1 Tax=Dorcoceras hygrometricum TaxID=472368 RepID=A0A2Z7C6L4_9LAMI|nr:hypothetical protein F511_11113 [Dorcoceras hygrometricum]